MVVGLEFWANISAVWLSLLCFIGLLIPLAAVYFAIRGMHAALGKSRSLFDIAQGYSSKMRSGTEAFSQKITTPVVKTGSEVAKADGFLRSLARRDRN